MKQTRLVEIALVVILVLTALVGLGGCDAEPAAGQLSPARLACIELMQKAPIYCENFDFLDVDRMRADPDLGDMYQTWYERGGDWLENFAIDSGAVDYLANAEVLTLAVADFSLRDVRDSLEADYELDTAYDAEVWVAKSGGATSPIGGAVALSQGLFAWGNKSDIDDYLSVINGDEPSFYDQNAAALLERMPEGVLVLWLSRYPLPEGLIISGLGFEKVTATTMRWTNVYLFESAAAAAAARNSEYFTGIEAEFEDAEAVSAESGEPSPYSDFSLELDGEFIEWGLLIETEYVIYMLFYG